MKLALAAALALVMAPAAVADDGADLVYLQPGATEHVTIPFAIGGTKLSAPKVARLDVHADDGMIDVTGLIEGKTALTVTEAGHPKHAYTVYVIVTKNVRGSR